MPCKTTKSTAQIPGPAAFSVLPFSIHKEMTMIAKNLLNLDKAVYTLNPNFCPNGSIQNHAPKIVSKRMLSGISSDTLFSESLEIKQFIEKIPHTMNKVLSNLAENELKVQIDAIDKTKLMVGFQKTANRITMGLIFASMIIGGLHLMYSMLFKDSG